MAALRAVGVRSDSGQDADCSDLVRLSVEVNQSRIERTGAFEGVGADSEHEEDAKGRGAEE